MEENKKTELAKEVLLQIYEIAKEYQSIAEKQEQEILGLKEKNRCLEEEREHLVAKNRNIDLLLKEMTEGKNQEIEKQQELIHEYLRNIADSVGDLQKKVNSFSKKTEKSKNIDEKIEQLLSNTIAKVEEIVKSYSDLAEPVGSREDESEPETQLPDENHSASEETNKEDFSRFHNDRKKEG